MPGLVPGIHEFVEEYSWMAGTSPAMTEQEMQLNGTRPRARSLRMATAFSIRSVNLALTQRS